MNCRLCSAFPPRQGRDALSQIHRQGRAHRKIRRRRNFVVDPEAMRLLAEAAMIDINHLLRPGHLAQLAKILDDPEATANDKFVAFDLLKNANIAAGGMLPMCQDTGTAIVMGKKGRLVFTRGRRRGRAGRRHQGRLRKKNLRYSQLAPLSMFEEKNTKTNLPAQIEIYERGRGFYNSCSWPRAAARPTRRFLCQGTPSMLTHDRLLEFLKKNPDARHCRLPAVPSRHRHRRHFRRAESQNRETRLGALLRRAADRGGDEATPSAISELEARFTS